MPSMPQEEPPTELRLNDSQPSLGRIQLDWSPQPGAHLLFGDKPYIVLERRHRYRLKAGRYSLCSIILYVQATAAHELTAVGDRLVIGDSRCRFNARSELIRCAVNPSGPCHDCPAYQPM